MKILIIHNAYGKYSGEEAVVDAQLHLLEKKGHTVRLFTAGHKYSEMNLWRKLKAFFTGLYNPVSITRIKQMIRNFRPDIVHIHNLYPIISPAILPVVKMAKIPIVMTVHNFRLFCPNGLFYTRGEICERCSGPGRELNCIRHNCEKSSFKSIGYALRNFWARVNGYYSRHVDVFACLTEFQQNKLIANGFPKSQTFLLPNFLQDDSKEGFPKINDSLTSSLPYVAFAGRLNRQKGFDLLSKAMHLKSNITIFAAGDADSDFLARINIPENIRQMGKLSKVQMGTFWRGARFLVFTSASYEGFPVVFLEAMHYHLPIIAPRLAAYPEIIEDGFNGLLYIPGDSQDLAEKISKLWEDESLRSQLGENGFRKLREKYSEEAHYMGLMRIYEKVIRKDR